MWLVVIATLPRDPDGPACSGKIADAVRVVAQTVRKYLK
jgi:hypothetical protein